jgi:hypothetical protein
MNNRLLTFDEARRVLGLQTTKNFGRFARRYGIPIIRFGGRCARVRAVDLNRAIREHEEEGDASGTQPLGQVG